MRATEPVHDPLGHQIHFPPSFFYSKTARGYDELIHVITDPAFIILVKKEAIYFFRLIDPDINLVIETKANNDYFLATDCIENPTVGYISSLLKKGGLISFSYF